MDYNFSYTTTAANGATIDVTLDITTAATVNSDGSFDITAIAGSWNGQAVTGLAATGGYGGNDNLFYPSDNSPDSTDGVGYATFSGFGFTVDTTGPGAIAGDDGAGNIDFYSGGQQDGVGDGELVNGTSSPATNEVVSPACYCAGTLIRTPDGDIAVELLAPGDLVTTLAGTAQPVRWIGRRSYAGQFLASRRALWPVRIMASALADGMPSRDLLVSPKHAMFLDGVLVAACDLVNGSTVVREGGLSQVDYFHIELAEHEIVWAEDAPSETFVDDDSRLVFHNAAEYAGPAAMGPAAYYAPRVTQGQGLELIRQRLNRRATAAA